MTRKEEILKAARDYVSGITLSSPSDVIHFENGAKWAYNNPPQDVVNLNDVWHDASEEPQGEYEIICQDEFEHVWLTDRREAMKQHESEWNEYAACDCIVRWAYINGLLQGGEQ